ncbi:MAG: hypothetical protein KCHDKBKB_01202 [Elusimicrobia bacterium]|nr:hypothetical protein [Elusimicrobiota bacterium]
MRLIFQSVFYSVVISLVFGAPTSAAVDFGFASADAGHAGAFLEYANSARTLAMAGASTAVSDDASAVFSNPAGLSQVERKEFIASYSTLFENTKFSVINYAQPTAVTGTFGLGFINLQSGDFERRDTVGEKNGSFGISDSALILSHGLDMGNRFSIGSSFKVIRQQVDEFSGTGYGLDGAAMMKLNPLLSVGLTLRNVLAPHIKLRHESDRYPYDIRLGSRWQATRKLMIATDFNQTSGRSIKVRLGGEWVTTSLLVFRLGINETELTTGLGLKLKDWGIDYAFGYNDAAAGLQDLGSSHRLGLHMKFGKSISEQEANIRWQKKGREGLAQLRKRMNSSSSIRDSELEELLTTVRQVIRRQGYLKAEDLYTAQGYVSYFEGSYERSVQALGEALTLTPQDGVLAKHLEMARKQMTEERTREIVNYELRRLKEFYSKGDWKSALKSCEKILSFHPDHIEASMYLVDARKQINEPIEREMKIAVAKFNRGEYLDAIKSFQRVKELNPESKEANDYIAKSIAALERLAATMPDPVSESFVSSVYEIGRNIDQSRELYSKGLISYSQGNLQDAVRLWEKAVQYDTQNALARNAYNRAQIELRDKQ